MVQPTFIQDIAARTSTLEENREGSLRLAQILGPVPIVAPPGDYSGQSPYETIYNLQLLNARLEPMAERLIQAVLADQPMWQMRPDFLYPKRNEMQPAGMTDERLTGVLRHQHDVVDEHDHRVIDPDDHPTLPSYVQAGFAEPNGGYFALVQPVRAGRGSFWVITGFILRSVITPNPTTPD